MNSRADRLAAAWSDAMQRLADATPGGWRAEHGDASAFLTRCAIPALNVAYSLSEDPDPRSLDELAKEVAGFGVPWSIIVRAAAAETIASVAERNGLTRRTDMPLMACAVRDLTSPSDGGQPGLIRRVGADLNELYTETLAAAFEAPRPTFGSLMGGGVLDARGFAGYLAVLSGRPVATGLGIQGDGVVGVFNIGVVPSARRSGLGRAMTARVMTDGFAGGATEAYLNPSASAGSLYESMGFRLVETWARYT